MVYIEKLEITAFGKFKNFNAEFENGLNRYIFENEYGKSTITDFIIYMLYGFKKTAKKDIALDENPLVKYMPWNGDGYIAGACEICADGEHYRIERRTTEKGTQKLTVYLSGSEISTDRSPGEMLFSADADTFKRTFLIRQNDSAFKRTSGIETALKNLVTTGNEESSFDDALASLKASKKKYRHERNTGRIFDIRREISELEYDTAILKQKLERSADTETRERTLKDEIAVQNEKHRKISELLPIARKSDATKLVTKIRSAREEIAKLELAVKSAQNLPDDKTIPEKFNALENMNSRISELEAQSGKIESEKARYYEKCPMLEVIRQNETEVCALSGMKPKPNIPLAVIGILLIAVGAALHVSSIIRIAVCSAGLVSAVLSLIFKTKVKIPQKYGCDAETLAKMYSAYTDIRDGVIKTEAEAQKCGEETARLCNEREALSSECDAIAEKYGIHSVSEYAEAMAKKQSADMLKSRISELNAKIQDMLGDKSEAELSAYADGTECEYTENELISADNKITARINELNDALHLIRDELDGIDKKKKQIFYNGEQIGKLETELADAEYQSDVYELAISALEKANTKINEMFSPLLTENASKPLSEFTNGRYDEVRLDKEFNILVKSDGELHKLDYFSKGTAEAVYFAVRSAVTDMISDKTGLPMIFDDPFMALDGSRLANAREYVEKLAQTRQVILFEARN